MNKTLQEKQDIIMEQYMLRYMEEADSYTKKELCSGCYYRSRGCFKCRAARQYTLNSIAKALTESARWN
jgi:hypothetical protein